MFSSSLNRRRPSDSRRARGLTASLHRHGFTLVELLVVIAILAIFAAILFPVFPRAQAKATQISCLSNVNQLGLAVAMYVQDYDESLPPSVSGTPTGALVTTFDLLAPHMKNTQIRRCPSDQEGSIDLTAWGLSRYSYSWNMKLFAYRLPPHIPGPPHGPIMSLATIPYPTETTTFVDGWQQGNAVLTAHRHSEGANVAFLDGHAKWHQADAPPRGCTRDNYHVIPQ